MGSAQSYSHSELIHLIWNNEKLQDQINILVNQNINDDDETVMNKFKSVFNILPTTQLDDLKSQRDDLYDTDRMRATIIDGIP